MKKKAKTTKAGVVRKVIKHVDQPEKVEITIPAADYLYQEIRIENKLEDEKGKEVKLKQGDNCVCPHGVGRVICRGATSGPLHSTVPHFVPHLDQR